MPINDPPPVIQRDWRFVASRAPLKITAIRARNALLHRVPAPAHALLKPPAVAGPWTAYFVYAPQGELADAHRFTLDRLADTGRSLLIVCATTAPEHIPALLHERADALIWKALPGFDFSAYGLALRTLATHAPGSDVLVMNDSVFGPLTDLQPFLDRAIWDLTAFTATSNVENHLQSYAFHLRDVTDARMRALAAIFPDDRCFDAFWDIVLNLETRFGRVANRNMSVGSLYFVDDRGAEDPMLQLGLTLVRSGFPFLKRSLLGKLAHLHPSDDIAALLAAAGHPVPR